MRLSGIAALATLCCLVGAPATSAKNMAGKFGAGYNQTLLGVRGLTFGYWSGTDLQLSMTVGSGFVLDASNSNTTTILASVGFKYVMVATKFANLSAGVRADLGWSSRQESTTAGATTPKDTTGVTSGPTTNVTQWGVEAPIEVEYFFSDSFSIFYGNRGHIHHGPEGWSATDSARVGQCGSKSILRALVWEWAACSVPPDSPSTSEDLPQRAELSRKAPWGPVQTSW